MPRVVFHLLEAGKHSFTICCDGLIVRLNRLIRGRSAPPAVEQCLYRLASYRPQSGWALQ